MLLGNVTLDNFTLENKEVAINRAAPPLSTIDHMNCFAYNIKPIGQITHINRESLNIQSL